MLIGSIGYILITWLPWLLLFIFNILEVLLFPFFSSFLLPLMLSARALLSGYLFQKYFPTRYVLMANHLGSSAHWILAALITTVFPILANNPNIGPAPIFLFFALMMVLQLIWVIFKMPETKGVPLEQLEAKLLTRQNRKKKYRLKNWNQL